MKKRHFYIFSITLLFAIFLCHNLSAKLYVTELLIGDNLYYYGDSRDLKSSKKHYYVHNIRTGEQNRLFNDHTIFEDPDKQYILFDNPDRIGVLNKLRIYDLNGNNLTEFMKENSFSF